MKKLIVAGLTAAVMAAGLTLVQAGTAGAATTSQEQAAAFTITVKDGLLASGYNCLYFANAVMNSKTPSVSENALILADAVLAQPGATCGPSPIGYITATPNATEGGTSTTLSHIAHNQIDACNGTYANQWNQNGHTASSWMVTTWGALFCYTAPAAGSPVCYPGSTAPGYSVAEYGCSVDPSYDPGIFVTVVRNVWVLNFDVSLFGVGWHQQWTLWEWENLYSNGAVETGCHVGFCGN